MLRRSRPATWPHSRPFATVLAAGVHAQSWTPSLVQNFAAQAHADGIKWMAPVAPQDSRPKDFVYSESSNTGAFRAMWDSSIQNGSDSVQITTWNDYSEGTEISPSNGNGYTWLDLAAYYITWYKTGTPPPITADAIYFCHRIQQTSLTPTVQSQLFSCVDGTRLRIRLR